MKILLLKNCIDKVVEATKWALRCIFAFNQIEIIYILALRFSSLLLFCVYDMNNLAKIIYDDLDSA